MFSFDLLTPEGMTIESYQSDTLPAFLANHSVQISQLFPSPEAGAVPATNWRADEIIADLQQVLQTTRSSAASTAPAGTIETVEQDLPLASLTPEQLAVVQQGMAQHYTRNDHAYVKFTAQVVSQATPEDPAVADLRHCIDVLQRGRSGACLLLVTEL